MTDVENKPIDQLSSIDLRRCRVWEYVDGDGSSELIVRPVIDVPIRNARNRVFGAQVRLANGQLEWAMIGNVDVDNVRSTEHFLTMSIERSGSWFHLAHYHDFDYARRSPSALAQFLGLRIQDVFPIHYDVRPYVSVDSPPLSGFVPSEPRERLTRAELIAMAVG